MGEFGILPERGVELINGEIIEISPIGSRHAARVNKLTALLSSILGTKHILSIQNPVVLNEHSEPEPDITILKYRDDYYDQELPKAEDVLLLIEVADSTTGYDRNIKLPLYAEHGIFEFWLINIEKQRIEAYSHPEGNDYKFRELHTHGGIINAKSIELELKVNDILS